MISFAPVTFLVLILIIGLVVLVLKKAGSFIIQPKYKWILGAYCLILFASLIVLYLLPQELEDIDTVSEEAFEEAQIASHNFYEAVMAGRPQEADGMHKVEDWEFTFTGDKLIIEDAEGKYHLGMMLVVERKDSHDGKIEVSSYATKTILELVDVTDQIKPPYVSLEGDMLIITEPKQYEVKIASFQREFILAQLVKGKTEKGETNHGHGSLPDSVFGADVLYVRIPQDVEVMTNLYQEFVGK